MKHNTFHLEASQTEDVLRITIRNPGETIGSYWEKKISLERIENRSRQLIETSNKITQKGLPKSDTATRIRNIGMMLADELLPYDVIRQIDRSDAEFLTLKTDDHLVHLPWELAYIGDEFLCQRFSMGRIISLKGGSLKNAPRRILPPFNMCVLSNPQGNLSKAEQEGKFICDQVDQRNQIDKIPAAHVRRLSKTGITKDMIVETIRSYDLVHYAGHAEYDAHYPEKNGWKLTGGIFSTADIEQMVGGTMPAFIFSNACQSARTEDWSSGNFSMAKAFLVAGVRHYIGAFWKIIDEPGSQFAFEFYKHLLSGEPVGRAVKSARLAIKKDNNDSDWACYVLYGEPEEVYMTASFQTETLQKSTPDEPDQSNKKTRSNGKNSIHPKPVDQLKTKKIPNRFIWSAIAGVLCFAAVIGVVHQFRFFDFHQTKSKPVDHVQEMLTPNPEIVKILMDQVEKKQARIRSLLKEVQIQSPLCTALVSSDGWTSSPVFMAMISDAVSVREQQIEELIAHLIQSQIKTEYPRIRLLDRKNLDTILEEITMERPESLELLKADLFVFIEANMSESKIHVLMRLENKQTGELIDFFIEKPEQDKSLLSQRDTLAKNLIARLKSLYPLQGKISEISGNNIILNIGYDSGVRVSHEFQAVDEDCFLKVISVSPESATVVFEKGTKEPKEGMKIILLN